MPDKDKDHKDMAVAQDSPAAAPVSSAAARGEEATKDTPPADPVTERLRINRAFQLAVIGLSIAAMLVIALLIAGWSQAADVSAVVGLFTSVIGTLVGAFFGLQIGAAGKDKADDRADVAQKQAVAVLGASAPEIVKQAKILYPDLFK